MPALPTFELGQLAWPTRSPSAGRKLRHFSRARYALHQAYREAGVGGAAAVLLPAYHCRTMVDGALALGAPVSFYAVHPDLAPDMASVRRLIAHAVVPVRALVVAHFFGFAQPMAELVDLCTRHGIRLIEDCSHVMIGPAGPVPGAAIGHHGAWAVASPYKFFPAEDGGLLWSNNPAAPATPALPPRRRAVDELKSVYRVWHAARSASNAVLADAGSMPRGGARPAVEQGVGRDVDEFGMLLSSGYQPRDAELASLAVSRWLAAHADPDRIAAARRARYLQWLQALDALPGARPLHRHLPEGCVPYMFALCLDDPARQFAGLKRLGVPAWRWDDMAGADCPVAAAYRLRLIHLPCHQSLTEPQMQWLIDTVRHVLPGGQTPVSR